MIENLEQFARDFAIYLKNRSFFFNKYDTRNVFEILQEDYEGVEREFFYFVNDNKNKILFALFDSIKDRKKFIEYCVCIM
jgi:hypothetical protein